MSSCFQQRKLRSKKLTIDWCAGFVDQTVALNYAIREGGLAPGNVDRGGGQLAEVNEAGSTGGWNIERPKIKIINKPKGFLRFSC